MDQEQGNGQAPAQPDGGGQGGELLDPHHRRRDFNLIELAIRNQWPVAPERKKLAMDEASLIVAGIDRQGKPAAYPTRDRISAMRVLLVADAINAKREATAAGVDQSSPLVNNFHGPAVLVVKVDGDADSRNQLAGSGGEALRVEGNGELDIGPGGDG